MNALLKAITLSAALGAASAAYAATTAATPTPPADAPAGTTGLCKDGSYYSGATKKGACTGHKGVKDWYGASTAAAPAAAPDAAAAPAPAASAEKTEKKKAMPEPAATAAPGGGPGLVWVNTGSKVYHCQGDKWYGKTKEGAYMSEADAKAKGNHADHGKACS
jgi:hypothetical protein